MTDTRNEPTMVDGHVLSADCPCGPTVVSVPAKDPFPMRVVTCVYCDNDAHTSREHDEADAAAEFDPRQPHGESGLFQHEPGAPCVVCDRRPGDGVWPGDAAPKEADRG